MTFRCRLQLAEALGPTNRWYCSQARGYPVDDRELLIAYFIKSGGAEDFAARYNQAMGKDNRWYCSEFYGREIRDPQILWDYFLVHAANNTRHPTHHAETQLCTA